MVMDRHDDFFLAWLARDARFQASVHFAPKTKLGYTIHRKVYTSMNDEPKLNLWLASKGVHGRVLRDVNQIRTVISLLEPVWDAVKDRGNLESLLTTMQATSARKMAHPEMRALIMKLDES
mgnify:FL=1|tara:strand:+ start:4102 stop:4464 length:363 start_codon:yes stop_codon:yes gene_type:complete